MRLRRCRALSTRRGCWSNWRRRNGRSSGPDGAGAGGRLSDKFSGAIGAHRWAAGEGRDIVFDMRRLKGAWRAWPGLVLALMLLAAPTAQADDAATTWLSVYGPGAN